MATTLIDWRLSALPAVCPSIGSGSLGGSRQRAEAVLAVAPVPFPRRLRRSGFIGHSLALPVDPARVPTPSAITAVGTTLTTKINNYIGTPAATALAVEGATVPSLIDMATGDLRNQQRGDDMVKGADARGIPPRGRRLV